MRAAAVLLLVLVVAASGCASRGPAAGAPAAGSADATTHDATDDATGLPGEGSPAAAPELRDTRTIEGRYRTFTPLGERLQEEGGRTSLEVAGWTTVQAALDSTIEVDLVLLPPGCAAPQDPCALRFSPPDGSSDGAWDVGDMAAGTWTIAVESDADDYTFVDGLYTVHLSFRVA